MLHWFQPTGWFNALKRHGLRTCLLALLVTLALGYLFLRGLGAFLITGDRLKPADAVVALGGGGEQRVAEAVRLIVERYGAWLILTEPGEIVAGEGPGSRYFRAAAVEKGLSPYAILVTDGIQHSTHDEALAVLRLMEQHQMQSIIVVTDPFHTQRTRMIFRSVFQGSGRTVRIHPVPDSWYRSGTWFLHKEGWRQTVQEYLKMAGFMLGVYRSLD
jgi:uncharacterized SAM-binding protein YcdF (DUF218 family)